LQPARIDIGFIFRVAGGWRVRFEIGIAAEQVSGSVALSTVVGGPDVSGPGGSIGDAAEPVHRDKLDEIWPVFASNLVQHSCPRAAKFC
jgi:hypothetical protein